MTPSTSSSAALGDLADVGDDELDPLAEAGERLLAEVQAVEHPHAIAALEQPRDQDAADVAGAARDQDELIRVRCARRKAVVALRALGRL